MVGILPGSVHRTCFQLSDVTLNAGHRHLSCLVHLQLTPTTSCLIPKQQYNTAVVPTTVKHDTTGV